MKTKHMMVDGKLITAQSYAELSESVLKARSKGFNAALDELKDEPDSSHIMLSMLQEMGYDVLEIEDDHDD